MPDAPSHQSETPLGNLLPPRVKSILQRNGIHTVEAVRRAYPDQLLKIWGMGVLRLKQIEAALSQDESFSSAPWRPPVRRVQSSSLNGTLLPATVLVLWRAGITTVDQLKAMKPKELLGVRGLGIHKLREIEKVFFPGQHYEVPRGRRQAAVDEVA